MARPLSPSELPGLPPRTGSHTEGTSGGENNIEQHRDREDEGRGRPGASGEGEALSAC